MIIPFLILIGALLTFALGLIVYRSDKNSEVNRLFFITSIMGSAWQLSNVLSLVGSKSQQWNLLLNQLITPSSLLLVFSLFLFVLRFPRKISFKYSKQLTTILGIIIIAFIPISFTSLNIYSSTEAIGGIQLGHAYPFYVGITSILITTIIGILLSGIFITKGRDKEQAVYIFIGVVLSAIPAFIFGALLPYMGYVALQDITPLFTVFFFSFTSIAIAKTKLFDVNVIVARSVSYIFSLLTLVLFYIGVLIFISRYFFSLSSTNVTFQIVLITIAVLTGLIIQPLLRFYNRFSNRIFFRDAYDTQVLLNEFNQSMVSTIDLNQLLLRSGETIEQYIKPETIAFAIRDSKDDTVRIISDKTSGDKEIKETIEQARAYMHKSDSKLFVTDLLDESQRDLKTFLEKANIGLLVRITSDVAVEGIGYIVMGHKKSGNTYTSQDRDTMEIIANELAIAIQNALQFEEIEKFNVTLQDKVDDATKKLRHTNEKLKALDETKDEFISMASHQLRTPLTSVKGYLSMVLENDAGEITEMQRKLLDQAFVSSQRMVYLIADLLNVSRLRTGKFVIEAVQSNLADVVEGEISQLKDTAAGRGLTLSYEKPANFPQLYLDETKIRQVIMNFTDNAIYYTPSGGHITVTLVDKPETIELTVHDDGMGVPKSEQPHMFTKFYRAGNARKARPDGTGLGLFMAKKVIVAQGGSIIFTSQEGKGSTFGFSLPKAKLQPPSSSIIETPED